jgi:hypothetical protein
LILLAFVLPLAVYLVVLGVVNRRPHPVMVSGTWDFIGLLFAASGFLLLSGPAILSSLQERWRLYWLLGQAPSPGADGDWPLWMLLTIPYFALILLGAVWGFRRRRHSTSIYNVQPATVEQMLRAICTRLGLNPVHSGHLFLFGIAPDLRTEPTDGLKDGVDKLPYLDAPAAPDNLANQAAVLEMDCFPFMNHVTLRWDPADTPLRREIEAALSHRLEETPGSASELGSWLMLVGSTLLCGTFLGSALLILARIFRF